MTDISPDWKPQATSRMCFVCGRENPAGLRLQFYEDVEAQQLLAPLNLPEEYQGYPGIVHGGILATILDEISGRSINVGRDEEEFWVTAKLDMRYRQPTPTQTPLTAVGWVIKRRESTAEVAGEIRLADGTVTAELHALIIRPHADVLQQWKEEQKHWRVEV